MSMKRPVVLTEPLGGSALSQAARAGELPAWYRSVPTGADAWRAYASEVRATVSSDWFDALSAAFNAGGVAAERLRASAERGIVVTTGQQPGLFGGPLMTLNKALTARAVADVLQRELDMPVAPVFWAATDDADFDEAGHVWVALAGGAVDLCLERHAPAGTPVSAVPMGEDVTGLFERLVESCGSFTAVSLLEDVRRIYRPGETIGNAYLALLRSVLEPLGIAVLDASHPAVQTAARPLLMRAAARAPQLQRALQERENAIRARGYAPQVEEVSGLSLVFTNEGGTKRRIPIDAAVNVGDAEQPLLSPTVLLRPVVERSILPTASYIAGPGEFAYFAQVSAVADTLDAPPPLVLPRWSGTILEPRSQRQLDALGATLDEIRQPHVSERRLARELMPDGTATAVRGLREHADADVDALRTVSNGLVPDAVLEGFRRSVVHRVDRLERRLLAATKRRAAEVMSRLATVRGALHPDGERQERKLSFVPLLARYGDELVNDMLDEATVHARAAIDGSPPRQPSTASAQITV